MMYLIKSKSARQIQDKQQDVQVFVVVNSVRHVLQFLEKGFLFSLYFHGVSKYRATNSSKRI